MSKTRFELDSFGEVIEDRWKVPGYEDQPDFGLLFDIDGVLGRGSRVLPQAIEAMQLLTDPETNELRVPIAFCTNACLDVKARAQRLTDWFGIEIHPDQVIHAPSPLSLFKQYHNKRALFIGQEGILERAHELGFINAITLDDVKAAYPLLDMVDHLERRRLSKYQPELRPLDRIEVIIMLGEPIRWESALQLLMDILRTNGKPDEPPVQNLENHLPIIACNMDLVYMDRCAMPRFGHGPFLTCLQELYHQFTKRKLEYTYLLGKPSEITFRFAEHVVSTMAQRMGYIRPIERLYFFGDNPDVDILGANLYNNYIRRRRHRSGGDSNEDIEGRAAVAKSRTIPNCVFLPQTARGMDSVLVRTGVYQHDTPRQDQSFYCHRDFQGAIDLNLPTIEVEDCLEGIQIILNKHQYHPRGSP